MTDRGWTAPAWTRHPAMAALTEQQRTKLVAMLNLGGIATSHLAAHVGCHEGVVAVVRKAREVERRKRGKPEPQPKPKPELLTKACACGRDGCIVTQKEGESPWYFKQRKTSGALECVKLLRRMKDAVAVAAKPVVVAEVTDPAEERALGGGVFLKRLCRAHPKGAGERTPETDHWWKSKKLPRRVWSVRIGNALETQSA